ncbi:chorismate mutase [Terrihabitans sp. B22-R8]|uniref:chorismate mutase n=1 Tax=Terrihabitans sp. B22-R8 TaxID=3425128 RepID=UPI00403D43DB
MTDQPNTLDELRTEIDRLDEAMHRLLIERGAIIDELVRVKRTGETGSAFRPGREADMMRRLVARHSGRLPFSAVEHIWRTIISGFTHVQAPYTVHVDGSGDMGAMRDLARFQMGFDVPLVMHDSARAVIDAVSASPGDLGLIGIGASPDVWWTDLGQEGQPQVMARLPFLIYPNRPAGADAVVIAKPLGDAAVDEMAVVFLDLAAPPPDGAFEVLAYNLSDRWRGLVALEAMRVPDGARKAGSYAQPIGLDANGARL